MIPPTVGSGVIQPVRPCGAAEAVDPAAALRHNKWSFDYALDCVALAHALSSGRSFTDARANIRAALSTKIPSPLILEAPGCVAEILKMCKGRIISKAIVPAAASLASTTTHIISVSAALSQINIDDLSDDDDGAPLPPRPPLASMTNTTPSMLVAGKPQRTPRHEVTFALANPCWRSASFEMPIPFTQTSLPTLPCKPAPLGPAMPSPTARTVMDVAPTADRAGSDPSTLPPTMDNGAPSLQAWALPICPAYDDPHNTPIAILSSMCGLIQLSIKLCFEGPFPIVCCPLAPDLDWLPTGIPTLNMMPIQLADNVDFVCRYLGCLLPYDSFPTPLSSVGRNCSAYQPRYCYE